MKKKISGYYSYWCNKKKRRIFKTLWQKENLSKGI
jgi:hypothetical protein